MARGAGSLIFKIVCVVPLPSASAEPRSLLLKFLELLLRIPGPGCGGGEQEVHLFQSPLVRLGVQGPDNHDAGDVDDAENVEHFFVDGVYDVGEN